METELHNPQGDHPEKKKRKKAVRRKRRATAPRLAAVAKAATEHDPLAGISQADCCFDCNLDHCAITGMNVCSHPYKGGLQSALQSRPDVVKRYQAARRLIAHVVTDKKMA